MSDRSRPDENRATLELDLDTHAASLGPGRSDDSLARERGRQAIEDPHALENVPQERTGQYYKGKQIGQGGQARVLLAFDRQVGREIAMKELLAKRSAGSQSGSHPTSMQRPERFLREAKITGQLEHPNIVPVYELGRHPDGTLYYTMRWVRGQSLAEALQACESLPERLSLLGHFLDLCNAIAYAHSRGVIHRDLKPANVMVGEFGETVVLDWGVAKVSGVKDVRSKDIARGIELYLEDSGSHTAVGLALGTPAYMSPEQAQGQYELIDERSDIWGLGAVLFEILTGHPPFTGRTGKEILKRVVRGRRKTVRELCPEAAPELAAIVEKAMRVDRRSRYASARDLAGDVRAYMTGERVAAYDYGSWELLRRFARKNKAVLSASLLLLATIIASLVFISILYRGEVDARRAESLARAEEHEQRLHSHFHLAQAHAKRAGHLIEERDYLAGRIYAAASLVYNPGNRKSSVFDPDWSSSHAGHEMLLVDAISHLYRARSRRVSELVEDLAQSECVTQLAFSPDGRHLATCNAAGQLIVYEVAGRRIAVQVQAHGDRIWSLAWFPDAAHIATGSRDGRVKVWRLDVSEPVFQTQSTRAPIHSVACSPDGERVVAGDHAGRIVVWEIGKQRPVRTIAAHGDQVWGLAFSPDGRRLASGSWDKTACIWDAARGKKERCLTGHRDAVYRVVFSPDGSKLASASYDKLARIWDSESGKLLVSLTGHRDFVSQSVFSADGRSLASCGADRTVRIWDAGSGDLLDTLEAHDDTVDSVAFSPDGGLLASAGRDHRVRLWRLESEGGPTRLLHSDWVYGVGFSPDGARVATGCWDRLVRLWTADGRLIRRMQGHTNGIYPVAFSADGVHLASSSLDGTVRVWDARTGKTVQLFRGVTNGSYGIDFSPDGRLLASGARDDKARIWRIESGERVGLLGGHGEWVWDVSFSPDGQHLATACGDHKVRIWDWRAGRVLKTLAGHSDWATSVQYAPDGRVLVSTGKDGLAILWDAASGAEIRRFAGHKQWVNKAALSPDGRFLATGSDDRLAIVWELTSGKPLLRLRAAGGVTTVAFSPDSRKLAVTDFKELVLYPLDFSVGESDPTALLEEAERAAGMRLDGFELVRKAP
ncbi:MAG: protein kinase [Deltaproteobacteria bacterium]|nr:protein kinase [Deltaproteobacteria bacterium]